MRLIIAFTLARGYGSFFGSCNAPWHGLLKEPESDPAEVSGQGLAAAWR